MVDGRIVAITLISHPAWDGQERARAERLPLRAGPVTAVLENGDLRAVRLGDATLARRIYVAVRDVSWATIPGVITDLQVKQGADSFEVTYRCAHHRGPIAFTWTARFAGASDGTIACSMDGVADDAFRYYRIGFCVLHPPRSTAGATFRTAGGPEPTTGTLPRLIEPPRIVDGAYEPLVPAYTTLEIEQHDGADVRFELSGDLFEMEDERSWTDASFKTYCTPYAAGILSAAAGQAIRQRVRITASARPGLPVRGRPSISHGAPAARSRPAAVVTLGEGTGHTLPKIGLGVASDGVELSGNELERLRVLRADHLRVELRLSDAGYPADLARARREARSLGCGLELVLFLTDAAERELAELARLLAATDVARVIVLHEPNAHLEATDIRWVRLVRARLGASLAGAPVGGGTNGNFAELVGTLRDTHEMDLVSYTANPQVHASDDTSIVENIETLGATVASARSRAPGAAIVVSRLTLTPPFGTYDVGPVGLPAPGELPAYADARLATRFGAIWALGSIASLASEGPSSVTLCETAGVAGMMGRSTGTSGASIHRLKQNGVFPVYHVLADLAGWRGTEVIACRSSEPGEVFAMALRAGGLLVLVANPGRDARRVSLGPLPACPAFVRVLDVASEHQACLQPDSFRAAWSPIMPADGTIALDLAPDAIATVRVESG